MEEPVETVRRLIGERGGNPGNFIVWESGSFLCVAVRPEAGAVEVDLPDTVNGRLVVQGQLP